MSEKYQLLQAIATVADNRTWGQVLALVGPNEATYHAKSLMTIQRFDPDPGFRLVNVESDNYHPLAELALAVSKRRDSCILRIWNSHHEVFMQGLFMDGEWFDSRGTEVVTHDQLSPTRIAALVAPHTPHVAIRPPHIANNFPASPGDLEVVISYRPVETPKGLRDGVYIELIRYAYVDDGREYPKFQFYVQFEASDPFYQQADEFIAGLLSGSLIIAATSGIQGVLNGVAF